MCDLFRQLLVERYPPEASVRLGEVPALERCPSVSLRVVSTFTLIQSFIIFAVLDLNWTVVIPLMACLLLSLMVNIILVCRLKKRQQGYDLDEKDNKIIEGVVVKHSEKPKIDSRVDKTWLLCRRSADVTEV